MRRTRGAGGGRRQMQRPCVLCRSRRCSPESGPSPATRVRFASRFHHAFANSPVVLFRHHFGIQPQHSLRRGCMSIEVTSMVVMIRELVSSTEARSSEPPCETAPHTNGVLGELQNLRCRARSARGEQTHSPDLPSPSRRTPSRSSRAYRTARRTPRPGLRRTSAEQVCRRPGRRFRRCSCPTRSWLCEERLKRVPSLRRTT